MDKEISVGDAANLREAQSEAVFLDVRENPEMRRY